jgi:hypothetical protein
MFEDNLYMYRPITHMAGATEMGKNKVAHGRVILFIDTK